MYKVNSLNLMTGTDILIDNYSVKIHQPSMKEISIIGEERFFKSLNLFIVEYDDLKQNLIDDLVTNNGDIGEEDLDTIKNFNDLDILLLLCRSDEETTRILSDMFNLIFKDYKFEFLKTELTMTITDTEGAIVTMDIDLFNNIKNIISQIFIFNKLFDKDKYNPANDRAKEIIKKLEKSKKKIEAQNDSPNKADSFFANLISILGVTGQNVNEISNLTIYQLYNQFERYNLYMQYNQSLQAAIAGAKVEIIDWFTQI